MTPEIDALLDGHVLLGVFPDTASEIIIGKFIAGHIVRVSRKKNHQRPDLEQLEGFDEIWALCPRKPAPGWRLLGRFYQRGVFVALRAWDKSSLARNYATATQEVIEDWKELFGPEKAHRANNVDEYLGGVFIDVDAPQG